MSDRDDVNLRAATGAVRVPRDGVRVAGPDATAFLQGQLSQDIGGIEVGSAAYSLVLQPQGKVDAFVRVTRMAQDELVLDVDAGWGEAVAARLVRFKLRTKVDIDVIPWQVVAVRGPGAPSVATADDEAIVRADAAWPGVPGVDLVGASVDRPPSVPECSLEAYDALRIEAGVPRMGAELDERTIPAEAGPWLVDVAVSFTKGCFTGQELVARIDSRGGNVPRRLRGVRIEDGAPRPGATLRVGDVATTLTSVAPRGEGAVALAYLPRAIDVPAQGSVDGAHADLEELPLVG